MMVFSNNTTLAELDAYLREHRASLSLLSFGQMFFVRWTSANKSGQMQIFQGVGDTVLSALMDAIGTMHQAAVRP